MKYVSLIFTTATQEMKFPENEFQYFEKSLKFYNTNFEVQF